MMGCERFQPLVYLSYFKLSANIKGLPMQCAHGTRWLHETIFTQPC